MKTTHTHIFCFSDVERAWVFARTNDQCSTAEFFLGMAPQAAAKAPGFTDWFQGILDDLLNSDRPVFLIDAVSGETNQILRTVKKEAP